MRKVVLLGGGVGSSTFTKALLGLPVELTTIVSSFDDGGSTGALRRDYGGIALGDLRQCLMTSLNPDQTVQNTLNFRFGRGNLYGVNVGNLFIKAFLGQFKTEEEGIKELHKLLELRNRVIPVSYTFSKLCAKLTNGRVLGDQQEIADYLNFSKASFKELFLKPSARLSEDARKSILEADHIVFAPGHFFTSVLPHIYVKGFAEAWKKSKAKKIWMVNLLAHKGQDNYFTLKDYFRWFEKELGKRPFDMIVINEKVSKKILRQVEDRFEEVKVTEGDIKMFKKLGIETKMADLVSSSIRKQQANDTIMRAPLRHDPEKIREYFRNFVLEERAPLGFKFSGEKMIKK